MKNQGIGAPTRQQTLRLLRAVLAGAVAADLIAKNATTRHRDAEGGAPGDAHPARTTKPSSSRTRWTRSGVRHFGSCCSVGSASARCAGCAMADVQLGQVVVAQQVVEVSGRLQVSAPKTERGRRVVAVGPRLAEELAVHLQLHLRRCTDAPLFPDSRGGYMRPSAWRKHVWSPVAAASGTRRTEPASS